jgi:hypothetical protein
VSQQQISSKAAGSPNPKISTKQYIPEDLPAPARALIELLRSHGPMNSRDVKARMAEQGYTINQTNYARVRLKLFIMQFGAGRWMYTHWSLPNHLSDTNNVESNPSRRTREGCAQA